MKHPFHSTHRDPRRAPYAARPQTTHPPLSDRPETRSNSRINPTPMRLAPASQPYKPASIQGSPEA